MITCENCGTLQNEGKFCGNCGKQMIDENKKRIEKIVEEKIEPENTQAKEVVPPVKENVYKEKITNYWHFFKSSLKTPSQKSGQENFLFGLITTIIALILFVLVPFTLINQLIDTIYSGINTVFGVANNTNGLGFSDYLKMLVYLSIFYVITVAITFFLVKKLGTLKSWKDGIVELGSYNTFIIIGSILVLLLIFFNSVQLAMPLLLVITLTFFMLIPLYFASNAYSNKHKIDKFLRFLITVVIYAVLYYIAYEIVFAKLYNELTLLLNNF